MSAPRPVFDVDRGQPAWDLDGVRYVLTAHAKERLIQMAGRGAIKIIGHVLQQGRRVTPPRSSKYGHDTEWVVLGDLTLPVETVGNRRNIITALYSNDAAWERHLSKAVGTGRRKRGNYLERQNLANALAPNAV